MNRAQQILRKTRRKSAYICTAGKLKTKPTTDIDKGKVNRGGENRTQGTDVILEEQQLSC